MAERRRFKLNPNKVRAWVERNFPDNKPRGGSGWINICNPFDGDSKYKFGINTRSFWVHDFRPSHRRHDGPIIDFVQKYRGYSDEDRAFKEIMETEFNPSLHLQQEEEEEIIEKEVELPPGTKFFDEKNNSTACKMAYNYLVNRRGFDEEMLEKYQIGYTATNIVFPYFEFGVLVYWQTRSTPGKVFDFPKIEQFGVTKSEFLYGFDNVESDTVIIMEAIIDAISVGPDAVAMGGVDLSKRQVKKVRALRPKKVIFAVDRDDAGVERLRKSYDQLKSYAELYYVAPPAYVAKDWNDLLKAGENPRDYIDREKIRLDLKTMISLSNKTFRRSF